MGNPRAFTSNFNARVNELEAALKGAGVRSDKRRRELMSRAAASRPADLAAEARSAIDKRRQDRERAAMFTDTTPEALAALNMLAGRPL